MYRFSKYKKIPPAPPYVPLAHKNFIVSEQLIRKLLGYETSRPFFLSDKGWEALQLLFDEYLSKNANQGAQIKNDPWLVVENFYRQLGEQLKNTDSEGGSAELAIRIDLSDGRKKKHEKKEMEVILSLTSPRDRIAAELNKRTLEMIKEININLKELEKNVNKINQIINSSFSFKKSKKIEQSFDYRYFEQTTAQFKDLARISEKYNLLPEFEDLLFYRLITEQLHTIKSVQKKRKTLFVMIDDSGSMDDAFKKAFVYYILTKIKEKLNDYTDAYIFSFESDLYDEYFDLKIQMPEMSFDGSGTNINRSLNSLYKRIQREFDIDNQNIKILIVNDGEDNPGNVEPPCPVFALMLKTENPKLERLCKLSGGESFVIN